MIRRIFLAALCLASAWAATPQLTTIQDLLYKADGSRFNGILTISWGSFESTDSANIVMQSITVRVVAGILRVQLVPSPSAPVAYYSVVYNSDGRVQFQETWLVPASSQPLKVSAVRVNPSAANITSGGSGSGPIPESQVTGLLADLEARTLEGTAFTPGRVAFINSLGSIDGVSGNASDCLHVDGSSGACGSGSSGGTTATFTDGESPAGIVDGANTSFTLSQAPAPTNSLALYRNGIMQKPGQDFSVTGSTVAFVSANTPQPGDTLLASYRLAVASGGTTQTYPPTQVLCSGTGGSTAGVSMASIGECAIPAGLLLAGDRVEIHFDLAHTGAVSGFTFEVDWAATSILNRNGAASDVAVSGRAEAAVLASGSQLSAQSWGTVLPFSAVVAPSTDAYASGITINFQGMLALTGDTLALANYSVVRVP
jgi:hypothetical protein